MAKLNVPYNPATGRQVVTLTSWGGTLGFDGFATTPVAGNQIEGSAALTINEDGAMSGPDGIYAVRQIIASSGLVEAALFTIGTGDIEPPILTNPGLITTGTGTATASVDTDTAEGELFVWITQNAVELVEDVLANGTSQTVNEVGTQVAEVTGLAPDTLWYAHFVHTDFAVNESVVASSAGDRTDPLPLKILVRSSYTSGMARTTVTLEDPIEPYMFEDWVVPPVVGEQETTQTAAGIYDVNGNFMTNLDAVIPAWHTALDGTVTRYEIDTNDLEMVVDTQPDSFTFTALTGQAQDTEVTSNAVTVVGVDEGTPIPVTITNGTYSVSTDNGQTWGGKTSSPTDVQLGYRVRVHQITGSGYNEENSTTLSIGGVERSFITTTVLDTVKPVITLVGGDVTIVVGEPWIDPGYQVIDNVDGDITLTGLQINGTVNSAVIGSYPIEYVATDSAGNVTRLTRMVSVVADDTADTTRPVITLVGGNEEIKVGDVWIEPGYSATDNVDGVITDRVDVIGVVNGAVAGAYTIMYTVSDIAGNVRTATRIVTVKAEVSLTVLAPAYRTVTPADASEVFFKAPQELLDFDIELTNWVAGETDTIIEGLENLAVVSSDAGLVVAATAYLANEDRIKVWLSGGEADQDYLVSAFITTAAGRRKKFIFRIVARSEW